MIIFWDARNRSNKLLLLLSLLSQFLLVFFLCISRAQTMHLERQSTQVNHSVHTLSTFLRIRADPSIIIIVIVIIIIIIIIVIIIIIIINMSEIEV